MMNKKAILLLVASVLNISYAHNINANLDNNDLIIAPNSFFHVMISKQDIGHLYGYEQSKVNVEYRLDALIKD